MSERELHPEVERILSKAGVRDNFSLRLMRNWVFTYLDNPEIALPERNHVSDAVRLQRAFDNAENKEIEPADEKWPPGHVVIYTNGARHNWTVAKILAQTDDGILAEGNGTIYRVRPWVDPSAPQPKKKKK